MLRKCPNCNKFLQYTVNDHNDLTYLKCPKCYKVFTDEQYVTINQRISQGYQKYEYQHDKMAYDWHERYIVNNEDEY